MQARLTVFRDDVVLIAGAPVGPFQMNQYVVACGTTRDAFLVDAGAPPAAFVAFCEERGLRLRGVLQTHGHIDHVAGLAATTAQLGLPIWLHPDERPIYDAAPLVGRMYGIPCDPPPPPDHELHDLDEVVLGELTFRVLHTPGHSPGHVVFHEPRHHVCLAGDLIFAGSVGRTDLPGSDPRAMERSLRKALELPDPTVLYPGHMAPTTMSRERRSNPFLQPLLR